MEVQCHLLSQNLNFHLSVLFGFSDQGQDERVGEINSFGNNRNSLWLLQLIIQASEAIQTFRIPWIADTSDTTPDGFESLQLPPSLLSLNWCAPMSSDKLEVIFRI